jgi:hypothetical protein
MIRTPEQAPQNRVHLGFGDVIQFGDLVPEEGHEIRWRDPVVVNGGGGDYLTAFTIFNNEEGEACVGTSGTTRCGDYVRWLGTLTPEELDDLFMRWCNPRYYEIWKPSNRAPESNQEDVVVNATLVPSSNDAAK